MGENAAKSVEDVEYRIRQRLPSAWPKRHHDVFITNRTNFAAQRKRIIQRLAEGVPELFIHALGAAIPRAIHLALDIQTQFGPNLIHVQTHTDTVELTDDFEPVRPDLHSGHTRSRPNSAIHLKLTHLLKEILRWLGLTIWEILVFLVTFLIFTILLTLKVEGVLDTSYWVVFAPLFISDALNAYFCVIVLIRMYLEASYKTALLRAVWSLFLILMLFIFKYLLCKTLVHPTSYEYSEVFSPVFILLHLVMVKACQLH